MQFLLALLLVASTAFSQLPATPVADDGLATPVADVNLASPFAVGIGQPAVVRNALDNPVVALTVLKVERDVQKDGYLAQYPTDREYISITFQVEVMAKPLEVPIGQILYRDSYGRSARIADRTSADPRVSRETALVEMEVGETLEFTQVYQIQKDTELGTVHWANPNLGTMVILLGEPVLTLGDVTLSVDGVENDRVRRGSNPKPNHRGVMIHITVTNDTDSHLVLDPMDFVIIDNRGARAMPLPVKSPESHENLLQEKTALLAGETMTFSIVVEIPQEGNVSGFIWHVAADSTMTVPVGLPPLQEGGRS